MNRLRFGIGLLLTVVTVLCWTPSASAFCGFYVAQADTNLFNQASQVAIARDGDRTVVTMANDFQGDVQDFAVVVPVPTVLEEDQVNVGNPAILERLDAFSAPRLVEFFDSNPCQARRSRVFDSALPPVPAGASAAPVAESLGVNVEAQFTVGEYDIVILSAEESNGLQTWLVSNGYRVPKGARKLLRSYIKQGMKFFVAKVNLAEFANSEYQFLRPLQMAYESPQLMLPIRLGMLNATGEQDLVVYILSPKGQAELTNYRTVDIPTDVELPLFVKQEFDEFYPAMFNKAHVQERRKVAFREYAWDMGSCDPCAANPLTPAELRQAGVFWLTERPAESLVVPPRSMGVFITRFHVRYDRQTFPDDLIFEETAKRQFFQGRYILRHPYQGEADCPAGRRYQRSLRTRYEREAKTLAMLTDWELATIREKMNIPTERWWQQLWN